MKILQIIDPNYNPIYHRTMNGYQFDGRAEIDKKAFETTFPHETGYSLERTIDRCIDDLYDGDSPICETDIGLCTVYIHWESKLPLCWCKIKKEVLPAE